ncbi:preprotein translocase subunit SecA, partial [Pelagibacterales bacterium SAG-MED45]|nr:preprotein translocase subunit SecA [Pelagibacterales bacterium SAG-MED45]
AQQKVEARNFDIRKTLIKFDNVLNDQRHVIFSQRKNVISSSNIFEYSDQFLGEIVENIIKLKIQNLSDPKNEFFSKRIRQILGKSFEENEMQDLISAKDNELKDKIKKKFEKTRNERITLLGEEQAKEIEKKIFLQSIDLNWKSHIQYLEQLRQVIGLRSYGQRDPLVEYKKEAFTLFSNLLEKLKLDFITILINLKVVQQEGPQIQNTKKIDTMDNPKCLLMTKKNEKISRNERCEATGKKFKNCCGAL